MILFDTPGIIEHKRTKLEERMMAAVISSIRSAEAIVAVVDALDQPQEALAMFQPGDAWNGPPMAVLLNKADLMSEQQVRLPGGGGATIRCCAAAAPGGPRAYPSSICEVKIF